MRITIEGSENVDALPYIDPSITEDEQNVINNMIQEEMSKFIPPNYLAQLPPMRDIDYSKFNWFEGEMTRMEGHKQMEPFDITRYKVNGPPANKKEDEKTWRDCLDNAKSQLEHQDLRRLNLELLQRYGANTWKLYLSDLELIKSNLSKQLDDVKKQIEVLNVQRKLDQESAHQVLDQNNRKWLDLVYKNKEIESACYNLESEIELLNEQLSTTDINNNPK
eukprot:gene422-534_t